MLHRFEIQSSLEFLRMAFIKSSRGCSFAIRTLRFVWENRSCQPVAPVHNDTDEKLFPRYFRDRLASVIFIIFIHSFSAIVSPRK